MSIECFLSKHSRSTLSRTGRVLVGDLIAAVDASVDQVQVVHFDVASAEIVRVLDVRVDVVVRAVRMESVLVQVVCPTISHSLAYWHLIFVVLKLVIITTVDIP